MSRLVAVALAIALATSVSAQDLSREQAGRVALGQCFNDCATEAGKIEVDLVDHWMDLYWDNWRDSGSWTSAQWEGFYDEWRELGCFYLQESTFTRYSCRQGCADIERAFGTSVSSARNVFVHELNVSIRALRDAGFWTSNWRDRPRLGTSEFSDACTTYVESSPPVELPLLPNSPRESGSGLP